MGEVTTYKLSEEELAKYRALPVPKKERPYDNVIIAPQRRGSMWSTGNKSYIKK